MDKHEFEALLWRVVLAPNANRLEFIWIKNYRVVTKRQEKVLREVIEARGWQLVAEHPSGKRIPHVAHKGKGIVASYLEQSIRTGYPYAKASIKAWFYKVGKFRNRRKADVIIDWVLYGMPHRALRRSIAG